VRGGEVEGAAGVVAVLVRDEDAVQVRLREAEAREALLRVAQVEAAVDEDASGARLGNQAVAAAAAGEGREAQDYLSWSCSSVRMRCVVLVVSVAPSLFSTWTWLTSTFGCAASPAWLTSTRY